MLSIFLTWLYEHVVSLSEQFRDSPVTTLALTNHPLTLSCYAPDPSPPPLIIWLHNEIYQPSDSRRNVTYDPTTGRSTYQLFEVSYSDSGQYQCLAINETGSILFQSDVGTLSVQGMPMTVLLDYRDSCLQLLSSSYRAASILTASDACYHSIRQAGFLSVPSC